MGPKSAKSTAMALGLSLAASAAVLCLGLGAENGPDPDQIARRLLWPLLRLMGFIGLGLVAGQVFWDLGVRQRVHRHRGVSIPGRW